jgi:hypothetical protein
MAVTQLQSDQGFDALEDKIDAILVRGDLRPKHG